MTYMLPRLTDAQLQKLPDIASDTGLIALGSVVLPAVLDRMDVTRMTLGLVATVLLWLTSIMLLKVKI